MPRLLEESEVDQDAEELDAAMTVAEEQAELASFAVPSGAVGDLSDGGRVGRATLYPMRDGKRVSKGRAAARLAWMWDGTETVLPLAWNPEGTRHDGARAYLSKRHCLCCGAGGFRGACRTCSDRMCLKCNAGTSKKQIIPCFYLNKEQVPFQQKFYGSIDCFLPLCVRRGGQGFKTEEDMRMHAQSRHRMEYRARQETLEGQRVTDTDDLRRRIDELTSRLLKQDAQPTVDQVVVGFDNPPGRARPRKERSPAQKEWAAELSRRAKAKAKAAAK